MEAEITDHAVMLKRGLTRAQCKQNKRESSVTKPPARMADHETPDELASLVPRFRVSSSLIVVR